MGPVGNPRTIEVIRGFFIVFFLITPSGEKGVGMDKMKMLKVVNLGLLVVALMQAATIIVMLFELKFISDQDIERIHKFNGLALVVLLVAHVVLNFSWLRSSYFRKK